MPIAYLKLDTAGQSAVITVTMVKLSTTGSWPVWKLSGVSPDGAEVGTDFPSAALEREYEFLGITSGLELRGKTVEISRSTKLAKNGKPYWNIKVLGEGEMPKRRLTAADSAGTGLPTPQEIAQNVSITPAGAGSYDEEARKRDWLAQQYLAAFAMVRAEVESEATAQSATATLWIGWQRDGLLNVPPVEKPKAKVAPVKAAPAKVESEWEEPLGEPDGDDLPF